MCVKLVSKLFLQVIACPDTMERLILVASNCLGLTATHVFTAQGGRIEDASLIRYEMVKNYPGVMGDFALSRGQFVL